MGKKKKKKKGCLGLLINFALTVICLLITAFIFYFVYVVVTAEGPVDPQAEVDKLLEMAKGLPEKVQGLIGQDSGGEATDAE
jgi:hypothetical protein